MIIFDIFEYAAKVNGPENWRKVPARKIIV